MVLVSEHFEPPKYAQIMTAIQQRISDGTYPPGTTIPSESKLAAEFQTARGVVVRALDLLKRDGWIDSHQGRGRFVLARPEAAEGVSRQVPERAAALLDQDELTEIRVVSVGLVAAPMRAANALDVEPGSPLLARRRLVHAGDRPVELSTVYVPVELAAGTAAADAEPLTGSLLRLLAKDRGVSFARATERIGARLPSAEEANLLAVGRRDCLLTVLLTVFDEADRPRLAIDAAFPATRQELEDSFPLA